MSKVTMKKSKRARETVLSLLAAQQERIRAAEVAMSDPAHPERFLMPPPVEPTREFLRSVRATRRLLLELHRLDLADLRKRPVGLADIPEFKELVESLSKRPS